MALPSQTSCLHYDSFCFALVLHPIFSIILGVLIPILCPAFPQYSYCSPVSVVFWFPLLLFIQFVLLYLCTPQFTTTPLVFVTWTVVSPGFSQFPTCNSVSTLFYHGYPCPICSALLILLTAIHNTIIHGLWSLCPNIKNVCIHTHTWIVELYKHICIFYKFINVLNAVGLFFVSPWFLLFPSLFPPLDLLNFCPPCAE